MPFAAPTRKYIPLERFIETIAPHFAYQLQFRSGGLERKLRSEEDIKRFLSAMYGGRTPEGHLGFHVEEGALLNNLFRLRPSRLLSEDVRSLPHIAVVECADSSGTRLLHPRILPQRPQWTMYVSLPFSIQGYTNEIVNWYRTREMNYKDELALLNQHITAPVLFIQALRDTALPAHLGKGMTRTLPHLTYQQINSSHWALLEKPKEVNEIIAWWLEEIVFAEPRARPFKL